MTLSSRYRDIPLMKQRLFKGARSHIWNRVYVGVLTGLWIQTWKWGVVEGWWQEMRKRSFHLVINWNSSRISCGNENIFFISRLSLCWAVLALYMWLSVHGHAGPLQKAKIQVPDLFDPLMHVTLSPRHLEKNVLWAAISCSAALSFHRRPLQSEPQH